MAFFSPADAIAQRRVDREKETKRLVRSVAHKLKQLKSQDATNFAAYLKNSAIPKEKIGIIYSIVDEQLEKLKTEWPKARKRYPRYTRKIIKRLSGE